MIDKAVISAKLGRVGLQGESLCFLYIGTSAWDVICKDGCALASRSLQISQDNLTASQIGHSDGWGTGVAGSTGWRWGVEDQSESYLELPQTCSESPGLWSPQARSGLNSVEGLLLSAAWESLELV